MKVLVTGSEGFIGTHYQRETSNDIIQFDRKRSEKENLENAGDVLTTAEQENVDAILHLGAVADVWADSYGDIFQSNVRGTYNVGYVADELDLPVVYTSSIACEEPMNRYARSKLMGEWILEDSPVDERIVRLTNVVGEGTLKGQVQTMIYEGLENRSIEVWGNGKIERSYVDVKDVVSTLDDMLSGEDYPEKLGTENLTNHQVAALVKERLEEKLGERISLEFIDKHPPSPQDLTIDETAGNRSIGKAIHRQVDDSLNREKVLRDEIKENS